MARPPRMRRTRRSVSRGHRKRRAFGPYRAPTARRQRNWFRRDTYWFKRAVAIRDITSSTVGVGGLIEFKLNDAPNYGEFTAMFDSYRINKVVLKFKPNFVETNVQSGYVATNYIPSIGVVIDYDSQASAPTSMDQLRQYSTFREYNANKPFKVIVVPRTAGMIFKSAVATGYCVSRPRLWLDCENADIPHYGVNFWMNPSGVNSNFNYAVTATYYLAFKGTR